MKSERLIDRYNRRWRKQLILIEVRACILAAGIIAAEFFAAFTIAEHPIRSAAILAVCAIAAKIMDE